MPTPAALKLPRGPLRDALWLKVGRLLLSVLDGAARRDVLAVIALTVIGAFAAALTPLALKLLLDALEGTSSDASLAALAALTALYAGGQYLTRLLTDWRLYRLGRAEQRVSRAIGQRVFEHLLRLPLRLHIEGRLGSMGQTAEQGVRGCKVLLGEAMCTVLPLLLELGLIAIVLVRLEHETYLAVLLVAAVAYVLAFQRGAADMNAPARRISQSHIAAHALLTDSLLNCETVKCFTAEPQIGARYRAALRSTEAAWRWFYARRAANGALVSSIFAACLLVTLILATRDVVRGAMTVGDFVLVHAYLLRLIAPLEALGLALRDSVQALAFIERMLELLGERVEAPGARNAAARESRGGEVDFDSVCLSYGQGRCALRKVTFRAASGSFVAIVGHSGAGKSSVLRLLVRLYEPDSGVIRIDGVSISEIPLPVLRRMVAIVPQEVVLFHDTIANNIAMRRAAAREEIVRAARLANIHAFIEGLPNGYDTVVGERGVKLSGGERQRIAIARALLRRARIIVLDEPTAALDSLTERDVLHELPHIDQGATVLVVTHRLSSVTQADQILVLDHGMLIERGTHAQLLAQGGAYACMWDAQHQQVQHAAAQSRG